MSHILTIVLFAPLAGLLGLLLIPSSNARAIRLWANVASFACFLVSLPLLFAFDSGKDFQFVERMPWIPTLGAEYHLGIDGLSLMLVLLTTLLGFLSILSSWNAIQDRLKEYYSFFLLLQTGMLGVFMALDFLLFFVFWELVLVPMYFIIGIWGGPRRVYAAIKFMIYTLIGSVLMLLGILTLYYLHFSQFQVYSFAIHDLMKVSIPAQIGWWVFWAFFLGFAVKVPMFPFHTWLPDAHVEAPTAGSVILASVLLKMGTYGFLRFSLPLLPDTAKHPTVIQVMALLSIVGIVYGALASLMQKDWKKLVAYSSISHLGFCTLGIFALNPKGISGSILQQINHGISTGMLFLIVGIVYERRHTREISEYGGLLRVMPVFTMIFLIAALSSMGMPPLNGFIGEITILQGAFEVSLNWAFWCVLGIALGAAYLLWLFQRTMLGDLNAKNQKLLDLSPREVAVFAPLVVLAFWIGLYPKPFFQILDRPVAQIVERVRPGYHAERKLPNPLEAGGSVSQRNDNASSTPAMR
ncbi:MAG: NADH-quinone oxidoreductase subunit M [Bryobacteraceae bacterium]